MKTIEEVLEDYEKYETMSILDARFSKRFIDFLSIEQQEKYKEKTHYTIKEEYKKEFVPKEWTSENIIKQLQEDVRFGWDKCTHRRGISSELMAEVVRAWCRILENGLADIDYGYYGDNVFRTVDKYYNFNICT